MPRLEDLRLRQQDQALGPFQALRHRPPPRSGWLKSIRQALGMSLRQLSERSGLSKTAVASAEASEARGTIQLDTLRRLADAMDCDLVYAIVPRDSLARTVEKQAERTAESVVSRVSESMEMEAQGVPDSERQRQVREMAAEILWDRGRGFWDV
jgi:predicted DNA-binding mobile mystery protein A